jgi:hypothetical protein
VKAKIDNVKAKIQDNEEKEPWSRPTLARRLVFGQLAASPTSSPLRGPPRQVSASNDKSLPRTTSPAPTGTWAQTRSKRHHRRAWKYDSPRRAGTAGSHASNSLQQGLNAGLTGCAAITSPSSPTLSHVSSARGTQAPSTMCTSLDLGLGVAN